MEQDLQAIKYPLSFQEENAKILAQYLSGRHSIVLLGIKRVGIGNFLRFFLKQPEVFKSNLNNWEKHLFIAVDLNDLFECEITPFWILTLKRIVDSVEELALSEKAKKEIRNLFLESIQLKDLFFTIDSVRLSIGKIIDEGFLPTLFFIRFDRLGNAATPELFANLEGLKNFSHQRLSFVFTSFVPFNRVFPAISSQAVLALVYKSVYIQPTKKEDTKTIYDVYKSRYKLRLDEDLETEFLRLVDGYSQYLQLGLIALHEPNRQIKTKKELFDYLINDERIRLQSEELWENLSPDEQTVLSKIDKDEIITKDEKKQTLYLWNTGLIREEKEKLLFFSPLFAYFVNQRIKEEAKDSTSEFSKKELLLFEYLKNNFDQICEREKIIEAVWPEGTGLGISDWAIDKLVERVRNKLKLQDNSFEIQTVKTRGFKLVEVK